MKAQGNNFWQRNSADRFTQVFTRRIVNPNFTALLRGVKHSGEQPAPIVLVIVLMQSGSVEDFANVMLRAAVGDLDVTAVAIEPTKGFVEFTGFCVGSVGGEVAVAPSFADDLGVDGRKFTGLVPQGFPTDHWVSGCGLKLKLDEATGSDRFGFALGNISNKFIGFKVFISHEFETNGAVRSFFAVAKVPLKPGFGSEAVDEFEGAAIEHQDLSTEVWCPSQGFGEGFELGSEGK